MGLSLFLPPNPVFDLVTVTGVRGVKDYHCLRHGDISVEFFSGMYRKQTKPTKEQRYKIYLYFHDIIELQNETECGNI